MELKLYNRQGVLKLTVAPSDNSARQKRLMGDHVLGLSFSAFECVPLEVYDYVDFEGARFWLLEEYAPKQTSTVEWAYDCKFYGIESLVRQALVLRLADGENEPVFSLTAPAREHLALIVANINRQMGTTGWSVGEVIDTENLTLDYEGTYCDQALSQLADAAKTEFWMDGMTLNLCRCEHGAEVVLGYGRGLVSLERTEADNVRFFTRLFPVGSTRNIDPGEYGCSRLQLPGRRPYVERNTEQGIVEHYERDAFSGIYPRRIGTVSSVRSERRTGEDGSPFTIYYVKDKELPFDPNAYEIGGLVKQISFRSGELNGRDFEVNYDSKKQEFEIITQWPYDDDTQLPGGPLVPKAGDEYVLWNIRMPQEYYALAEQEFAEAVDAYMLEHDRDRYVYKGRTDYIDITQRQLVLDVGRRVRLESDEYFPGTGYRASRITSLSQSVACPAEIDIEVSDLLERGALERIDDDLGEVRHAIRTASAALPGIIRSWEETAASDSTLYTSRKSEREFLNRRRGGTVEAPVRFSKEVAIADSLVSSDYRAGDFAGAGMRFGRDANGDSVGVLDKLVVRKSARFNEVVINQITFHLGENVFSCGGFECTAVEEQENSFRCFYDNKEGRRYSGLVAGDQVRCQRYDAANRNVVKYYWRLVVGTGENHVDLSKADCDGTDVPEAGDNIVQFGHRTDRTRQSAIVIDPKNGGSVEVLAAIDSYTLSDRNYAGMGVDPRTGRAYVYGYGDIFFGDRDMDDPASKYFAFRPRRDDTASDFRFKGYVEIMGGSSGLDNFAEWSGKQEQIDDAARKAQAAAEQITEAERKWAADIKVLQDQVDGVIESFSYPYTPTAANYPASEWDTEGKKQAHVGDVFYNIQPAYDDDGTPNPDASKAWRWSPDDAEHSGYHWHPIADSDAVKALQLAQMSVTATDVLYIQSASSTDAPDLPATDASGAISDPKGWSTEAPEWAAGRFIWQTTYVRRGDGAASFSAPTCISGRDGASYTPNLLRDSEELTVTAPNTGSIGDNYVYATYEFDAPLVVVAGDKLSFSVEGIEVLAGGPAKFSVYLFDKNGEYGNMSEITQTKPYAPLPVSKETTATGIAIYAGKYGECRGNSVKYIRAMLVKGDNSASWSPAASEMVGQDGADGVGVQSITEQYYLSTSRTALAGGSWSDTRPEWIAGRFYWTRSKITYTDGSVEHTGEVCATGESGQSYSPNLLLKSEEATTYLATSQWGPTGTLYFDKGVSLKQGDTLALSIERIENLSGNASEYTVGIYDEQAGRFLHAELNVTAAAPDKVFTITHTPADMDRCRLYIYAGRNGAQTGNQVRYTRIMIAHGTAPMPWSPAASEMVGRDGQYTVHQWAKSSSATSAPTGGWQPTPPAAAAGEYVWMRSGTVIPPATDPAWWDDPVRLTGDSGRDGQSVYLLDLSNEVAAVACDAAGNVVGSYPASKASVYKGAQQLTSGVSYSIEETSAGITAEISASGLITLSGLTADTATVVVKAAVAGLTLRSTISVYKVRPGAGYTNNLLTGTKEFKAGVWNRYTSAEAGQYNGLTVLHRDNSAGTAYAEIADCRFTLENDTVYTLSAWMKGSGSANMYIYPRTSANILQVEEGTAIPNPTASDTGVVRSLTTEWRRYYTVFRTLASEALTNKIVLVRAYAGAEVYACGVKLEKGANPSSEWSPADQEMTGTAAVMYSLLPSVDSVTRSMTGTLSARSVSCTVYKTTGDAPRVPTGEKTLKYQRIGVDSAEATLAHGSGVSAGIDLTEQTEAVIFSLYDGTVLLDRERVPVLSDASDLKVGGINLLDGTHNGAGWTDTPVAASEYRLVTSSVTSLSSSFSNAQLRVGTTYTLSFFAKRVSDLADMNVIVRASNDTTASSFEIQPMQAWEQYRHTFVFDADRDRKVSLFIAVKGTDVDVSLRNIMLEEGNIVTGYTLSAYDLSRTMDQLSDIVSDSVITPFEKDILQREWLRIQGEYADLADQAARYGIDSADYAAAYEALSAVVTPVLRYMNSTSEVSASQFEKAFAAYYAQAKEIALKITRGIDESTKYLRAAIQDGSTNITGGLVMTNVLLLRDLAGVVQAGVSGLMEDEYPFFAGATYEERASAPFNVSRSGAIRAMLGKIGVMDITNNEVTVTNPNQGNKIVFRTSLLGSVKNAIAQAGIPATQTTAAISASAPTGTGSRSSSTGIFSVNAGVTMRFRLSGGVSKSGQGAGGCQVSLLKRNPEGTYDTIKSYYPTFSPNGGTFDQNESYTFTETGIYKIQAAVSAAAPSSPIGSSATALLNKTEYSFVGPVKQTRLYPDGIAVVASSENYMVATGNLFEVRKANGGVRLHPTSGALQKYQDGEWVDV